MADYIPRKDAELASWSSNFASKVDANSKVWNIPGQEVSDLNNAVNIFSSLHAQVDSPAKNSIIVAEKNAARIDLIGRIRGLVGFRLRNPAITNAERIAMGLPARDNTFSSIPTPTSRPELNIDVFDVRRLKVHFRDMGSSGKARPYGVIGAVIAYAVLNAHPTSPTDLTNIILATRTPYTLEFTEPERGRTVYVAICWQNEKGEKGPWSEMESAIVP
jgi:hypothetical protein